MFFFTKIFKFWYFFAWYYNVLNWPLKVVKCKACQSQCLQIVSLRETMHCGWSTCLMGAVSAVPPRLNQHQQWTPLRRRPCAGSEGLVCLIWFLPCETSVCVCVRACVRACVCACVCIVIWFWPKELTRVESLCILWSKLKRLVIWIFLHTCAHSLKSHRHTHTHTHKFVYIFECDEFPCGCCV